MIAIGRRRGRSLEVLLGALLTALSFGCAQNDGGIAKANALAKPAADSPVLATPAPASPLNPYADDVSALRFRDREKAEVLVRSEEGPFISVGEFNAWLGSYPLRITGEDLPSAQRQALEQMVTFKLVVESARLAGYENRLGPGADQKSLALSYLSDQINEVASISSDAANRYAAENPELFAQLGPEIPPEVRMVAVKSALRGAQLRARIREMEQDAGIRYDLSRNP